MKPFNVLDANQNIFSSHLIEASAGTGKTFAIENLVVRLLIEQEGDPLTLDQILIVTFTKAATNDLKLRIRDNIENALNGFKHYLKNPGIEIPLFDYLMKIVVKGEEAMLKAKSCLEQALFCFDQAQIFTIHSFCWQMLHRFALEGNVSVEADNGDKGTPDSKLIQILRDYLRTGLKTELFSQTQLKVVLNNNDRKIETLLKELLKYTSMGADAHPYPSYLEQFRAFQQMMRTIKTNWNFSSEKILADFIAQAPLYNGILDRSKKIKREAMQKMDRFASLFDKHEWTTEDFNHLINDGVYIADAFDAPSKRKKPIESPMHYPEFLSVITRELSPLVEQARSYPILLARMIADCQPLLRARLEEEELLRFDDLLNAMHKAIQEPSFSKLVQGRYKAAVIDEFQDTDPMQWGIFRNLFLDKKWNGFLYLVGDPKQSIYSFRQADVYTYLAANRAMGENNLATLETNYRSQPCLIEALNFLFNATPDFIYLPYAKESLPYRPVKAGLASEKIPGAPIRFMISKLERKPRSFPLKEMELKCFFPFIANEIRLLSKIEGFRFSDCAILVSDRFQAARLSTYLKQHDIAAITQKSTTLLDSPAIAEMRELLNGILHFRHGSSFKTALGSKILGWTHQEICRLDQPELAEEWMDKFQYLRKLLLEEGFIRFFDEFMEGAWNGSPTIAERLLSQADGIEYYQELQQTAQLLSQQQCEDKMTSEGLLGFLDEFNVMATDDDERFKILNDRSRQEVQILTIHASKGLEFAYVFALGLCNRNKQSELLIPIRDKNKNLLTAISDRESKAYKNFCEELDAEKSRQLYVAMTRAKISLYLPAIYIPNGTKPAMGTASPMELFLARLGQPSVSYEDLYQRIEGFDPNGLKNLIERESKGDLISVTEMEEFILPSHHDEKLQSEAALIPPVTIEVPGIPCFIQSFTSISKPAEPHSALIEPPHDFNTILKNSHTLPAGTATGILLHKVAETLPFEFVHEFESANDLLFHVSPIVSETEYATWEGVISELIFHALTVSVDGFSLKDLDPRKIHRETEFLYADGDSYLKGVIDMFFEHRGKYYLLDWKSNWLGPSSADYQEPKLREAMELHQYGLQASLYAQSLKRFLSLFDPRPFEQIFGGAIYLFLRGLRPGREEGIFHFTPQHLGLRC